jgi:hypothetical protein
MCGLTPTGIPEDKAYAQISFAKPIVDLFRAVLP